MPERVHHRFSQGDQSLEAQSYIEISGFAGNNTKEHKSSKKRKREEPEMPSSRCGTEPQSGSKQNPGTLTSCSLTKLATRSKKASSGNNQIKGHPAHIEDSAVKDDLTSSVSHLQRSGTNRRANQSSLSLKEKAFALRTVREKLPIWSHAEEIRKGLWSKDVTLLVGETGSGKSTQVPQFLIDEPWCKPEFRRLVESGTNVKVKVGGCIAITEPRRVAAITLARRVAEEMGTPLGSSSPASKVGYSVRFDNSTSPSTRIKYLTEGMLLQEMLRDPWLRQYSAVIVDEVHERGADVDLVMGFLRNIVSGKREGRGGIPLKVVVMSATADMKSFLNFFEAGIAPGKSNKHVPINCKSHLDETSIITNSDERQSEWSSTFSPSNGQSLLTPNGIKGYGNSIYSEQLSKETVKPSDTKDNVESNESESYASTYIASGESNYVSTCYIEGRQYPVSIVYSSEPVQDYVDAALRTIFQIHYKEPLPGDILVFLTGQETVESLEKLVEEYALGLGAEVPKLLALPLFAALPRALQERVFQPAPPKTRKVILATNIAETSVTVAGVRFVIDCGKSKLKQFRSRLGLDSLLVKPVSKSAAIQRKGRAGREASGKCYRLYTEQDYLALPKSNTPEILRCDLSQAILMMKARGIDDIIRFPFLDRPPREALEKALTQLLQLGALKDNGSINETGLRIAELPLTASLGRVLLAAAEPEMDCLLEAVDIISCLSVENVFLNLTTEESKEDAETARRALIRREGDHLTLLMTVQAYASEHSDRKTWATKHFVSHRAMQAVMVCW